MWKKILIIFVFMISVFTMAYNVYNQELHAAPSSAQYYGIDAYDNGFARTGKKTIRFSGIEWTIVHADPSTGKGILLSEDMGLLLAPMGGSSSCIVESISSHAGAFLTGGNLADCRTKSDNYYKNNYNIAGQHDDMGEIIKNSNPNLSPSSGYVANSMTLAQYQRITNYKPSSRENAALADPSSLLWKLINNTWMDPNGNGTFKIGIHSKQIYYWGSLERIGTTDDAYDYQENPKDTKYKIYNGYNYVADANTTNGEKSRFTLAMEIDLPQKNFISSINTSTANITRAYDDSGNAANTLISKITTVSGEGPYHFYVYDTDASGNGTYTTPSANFQLSAANGISTTGNIDVNLKKKLPVGDYYFKVKVIDESTNTRLYIDPTDFTKDSYRTKESGVIHVSITKAATTLAFTNTNTIKIKIGDPAISETITTNHGELTVSGANAPTYTISNGIGGTGLTVTNDASNPKGFSVSVGSSTSASLPASFTLTATTPTTQNYKGATTTKSILVFKELSALNWLPAKSGNFATSDVVANAKVGELLASDGIANYTYALTQPSDSGYNAADAGDNALFIVDNTPKASGASADVKTGNTLGSGIYHIQFKVTDDNGDVVYQKAEINVSTNTQPPLEFKENGSTITKKTIYFDETNTSVKAEGGLSSIPSLPRYSLSNNQISGITASDYLKVDATTGLLTPLKVTQANKPIKVKATKAGDAFYSGVSTEIEITILPAKQSILFDNNVSPRKIKQDDTSVIETA